MTQKELQQMLDSFQKEVTKKDWEIDRDVRLVSMCEDAAKIRGEEIKNDKSHQSSAGKARAQKGGKEQLQSVTSFEARSKGGITSGNNNVKSGHWKKVQEAALEIVTQEVECPHCGSKGNLNIMKRWHFDKCKWQGFDFSLVFTMDKQGISQNQIARELGITRWNVRDILNGEYGK